MEFKDLFTKEDRDLSTLKELDLVFVVSLGRNGEPSTEWAIHELTVSLITDTCIHVTNYHLRKSFVYSLDGTFLEPEHLAVFPTRLYRYSKELSKRIEDFLYRESCIRSLVLKSEDVSKLVSSGITLREIKSITKIYDKHLKFNFNKALKSIKIRE